MGPGHFAIAFAAKPTALKVPLWVLLLATEVLDLLSFAFQALGIEDFGVTTTDLQHGVQVLVPATLPWSHGLFMSIIWSLLAAGIAYLVWRDRQAGMIVGLAIFSHWVLDFIVHLPDLPLLFSGSPRVGLGLWGSGAGLVISGVLEIVLLAAGTVIYLATRKRKPEKEAV